jgi:hypothetical protein
MIKPVPQGRSGQSLDDPVTALEQTGFGDLRSLLGGLTDALDRADLS